MKRFEFSLEDILKFRKFEQRQAEIELGRALMAEKEIQDKLDALAAQKISTQKNMRDSSDFQAISAAGSYLAFVREQTDYLLNRMAEANIETEKKREILKLCIQKTDSLEDLKEAQLEEYRRAVLDEEDRENDDIVTSRIGSGRR